MGIPPRTYGALQVKLRESLVTRALVMPIQQFIHIQGISSFALLAAAVIALLWSNSPWHDSYHHVWEMQLTLSGLQLPVHAWINDALMAIFFFLVGMEIKHEIVHGELADIRRAALPIVGALGGMIVPAVLFVAFNYGHPGQHGWGVPMATDIAFSLGVLGMVKGIPSDLKVFLLSLAIADDIGAIIVIAIFYSGSLDRAALFAGLVILALIFALLKVGISRPILYFVLGVGFWVAILQSGIHATIAGVILGFMVPTTAALSLEDFQDLATGVSRKFRDAMAEHDLQTAKNLLGTFDALLNNTESTSERLTRRLNDWVSFLVLPLFALANAGVTFSGGAWKELLASRVAWGVVAGLVVGKPLGIIGFAKVAVRAGFAQMPKSVTWKQLSAVGILAGIGFTVSIFISSLAFDDPTQLMEAKTAVLGASVIAGVAGYFLLKNGSLKVAHNSESAVAPEDAASGAD
ncbi:MAG TPA: Na+/H+ antiporter NhaA [Verrucomicrobiae bacterium]|jgi:NhaA family Na+:H+ antiporter|nr:Na+/H+ antiporter NhaA [Verrucomicrobiae bacterium]